MPISRPWRGVGGSSLSGISFRARPPSMKAFVTGASGFLGHAVCAELLSSGHEVSALVRRPGSEPDGTEAIAGDLRDGDALARAVREAQPDCVIHLAAEIATQRDPNRIEEVNVAGTRRLLDAGRSVDGP